MRAERELEAVLAAARGAADLRELLQALLTPSERARLVLRWELVRRLEAGEHQREIAGDLGISLCKITRGSRELKRRPRFRRLVRAAREASAGPTPHASTPPGKESP